MDGVTATTAEINLIDGGTSRGTTAVANGDGFLHNDGGTMRMTNVSKLAEMFGGNIKYIPARPGEAWETLADITNTIEDAKWIPETQLEEYIAKKKIELADRE